MNVLLLSVGTRNKVVKYFKENLKDIGNVIATDCWELAPAIYDADKYYIVPKINEPNYIDVILDICKKENIVGVLSLIDPELLLLSKNIEKFNQCGVKCIISPYNSVDMAFDKMKMYDFCINNGINTIQSYNNITSFENDYNNHKINFPVFVKPICGSCSINIQKVNDFETLRDLFRRFDNLMIQKFMCGQEIGADVYIDSIAGQVISIFTKKKLLMRAGETDKSVSFKDEKLFNFIENFVLKSGYRWNIDLDIFEVNGEYFISEVNPRFGGGYPHAYESGCNFIKYIINNLNGVANLPQVGEYESNVFMMKYLDLKIIRG